MSKYKTEQILSTHSFDSHDISVISMSDPEGNLYKGIGVFPIPLGYFQESVHADVMGDYVGMPLIIDDEQALLFCRFIEEVINMQLPRKIRIHSTGPFLKIQVKKYVKNWHDGGAYKGYVTFGNFGLFANSATITKYSIMKLRQSLIDLFDLNNIIDMNV